MADNWKPLNEKHKETTADIEEALQRIKEFAQLAEFRRRVDELASQQELLAISSRSSDTEKDPAKLPCHVVPVPKNARFYDRDNLVEEIDDYFNAEQTQSLKAALTNSAINVQSSLPPRPSTGYPQHLANGVTSNNFNITGPVNMNLKLPLNREIQLYNK